MKKLIFISGIISSNLMLFGSIFKVMHWPGAGIMLSLAIAIFCLWFLPMALISSYKSQNAKKYKALYIITFIVFFIVILGALFKIMHWPGSGWFLVVGIPLPFVLFLPVYIFSTRNEKKDSIINFMGIMFGLTFLAVFSVLLSLNVSYSVLDKIKENIISTDNLTSILNQKNKSIDSSNVVVQRANELYDFIENLKCDILLASNNKELCKNRHLSENYCSGYINNIDNTEIAPTILFNHGRFEILKNKVNDFAQHTSIACNENDKLKTLIKELFDTNDYKIERDDYKQDLLWENRLFSSMHLVSVLNGLSRIQFNLRLVESEFNTK